VESKDVRKAIMDAARTALMLRDVEVSLITSFEQGDVDIRISQLNFESMAVIEFCIVLEEQYGFEISARKFYELTSLGELASLLETSVDS
jgi:acyl carrier protein